ncbi:MAG: heme-binding protein [Actinobacteria bacterium]|nr:heme-binding protein [Actinomycetota bacterium]
MTVKLTMDDARTIAEGIAAEARVRDVQVSCSVVDARGIEIITMRMDGAPWFTPDVARTKARTAAVMRQSTADLARLKEAYPDLISLIDDQLPFTATTLPGGVVVERDNRVVGGVGVSGAHPDEDIACARAAIDAWIAAS